MTWAKRRQLFFLGVIFGLAGIAVFFVISPYINKPPTCFDGKQNGAETGADCGGACQLQCTFEAEKISVLWARAFEVLPGRYNAVAYLESKNENTAVDQVSYRFRFADSNNIYIGKREGVTFIPPAGRFAIFEPAIDLGNSVPVYTTFEFTSEPAWLNVSPEKVRQLNITAYDIELQDEDTAPKLFASIRNDSLFGIPEVSVVAILYDELGNALAASSTYLDSLPAETILPLSYTWPKSYGGLAKVKELIPMFNIFRVETN